MATNPDIQEKAQQEIDRVVGRSRLPDFSDRSTLPYLEAIYREVLRCRPPLHLGFSHQLTEDDHYKGISFQKVGGPYPKLAQNICSRVFLHPAGNRHDVARKYMV